MITLQKIQHPVYTNKLQSPNNAILFDIRPKRDYLKRFVLLWRIRKPELLNCKGGQFSPNSLQSPKVFDTRIEARRFLMSDVIELL